ncbi:MAG TPA: hypothetical protein VMD52_08120 [Patescibacteria group bacterium]|nr:hypothetical protein [Patescibacteria group bacterium]
MKKIPVIFLFVFAVVCVLFVSQYVIRRVQENKVLKEIIARLQADSRIAEVLVTDVRPDATTGKELTTIKFLEYDTKGRPLAPRYFTFPGNIIQFQSLVIRFNDLYIATNDPLRGKSVYLFWKVFMLDGANTREFEITRMDQIPQGYKIDRQVRPFERRFWKRFWEYALNAAEAKKMGIKNAQIEAPGTMFVPGTLYTIKIEHDGGMRIDTQSLPAILRGERIPKTAVE